MAEVKPYVGDTGTLINVETGIDLSGVVTLRLDLTKPDGNTVAWVSTVKSDDTSVAEYTVQANDFDIAGAWTGQVYAFWDGNNVWRGQTFHFDLFPLRA